MFGLPSELTLSSVASMAWMPSRGSDLTPDQTNKLTYPVVNLLTQITSKEVKKLFVFGLLSELTLSSVASMAWMPSRGRMLT